MCELIRKKINKLQKNICTKKYNFEEIAKFNPSAWAHCLYSLFLFMHLIAKLNYQSFGGIYIPSNRINESVNGAILKKSTSEVSIKLASVLYTSQLDMTNSQI